MRQLTEPLVASMPIPDSIRAVTGGAISSPSNKAIVRETCLIRIDPANLATVRSVYVRIDSGSWVTASKVISIIEDPKTGEIIDIDIYWKYNWITRSVSDGSHSITARVYNTDGTSVTYNITVTVHNIEKIAVFFWASDALISQTITKYTRILKAEGYTIFFNFQDTTNFARDFNKVNNWVKSEDTVFFYLCGHGHYFSYEGFSDSYTNFRPNDSRVIRL